MLDEILHALGYPQRKLKEGVAGLHDGDEREWFPQGEMPPELYAAGNTALDIVADPLNLLGTGLLASAGKGAKQLPGAIASVSNYIPGYYGTATGAKESVGALGKLVEKLPDLAPEQAKVAAQSVEGMAGWAANSAKDALGHLASPTSRANWAEHGATTSGQKHVKEALESGSRGRDKAFGQLQYEHHINRQGNAGAGSNAASAEAMDRSFAQGATKYTDGDFKEALTKHSTASKVNPDGTVSSVAPSKQDTDYVAELISKKQKMGKDSEFVVKNPGAGTYVTGGHFSDLLGGNKNKAVFWVKDVFKKFADEAGNVDPKVLREQIQKRKDTFAADTAARRKGMGKVRSKLDKKEHPFNAWVKEDAPKDGAVWLEGGHVGAAVTEGGVGWVMKVEPNGNMTAWMHDKHDFLENLVPLKETGILPTDMVAVSPAMTSNIKQLKMGVKDGTKFQQPAGYGSAEKWGKGAKGQDELLESYMNLQPSKAGVNRERRRLAGKASLGTGLLAGGSRD